jgi:hypothetical protein
LSDAPLQIATLASKEVADCRRTHLLVAIAAFMLGAGSVALVVAAQALHVEVASYFAGREALLALGKSVDALTPPAFCCFVVSSNISRFLVRY